MNEKLYRERTLLAIELGNQGAEEKIIRCVVGMLKTTEQVAKMMDWLFSIRNIEVNSNQAILIANKIAHGKI